MRLVDMSDDEDGEIGGDSALCDNTGEHGGMVKGDEGWDVRGDDAGSVLRDSGFTLRDLVRGASAGSCGFKLFPVL
jgi:hypothetical protein